MFQMLNFNKLKNNRKKNKDNSIVNNNNKNKLYYRTSALDDLAATKIKFVDFEVKLKNFWDDISGADSSSAFYNDLQKLGLKTTTSDGIEFRDPNSYYELIISDYSILPQTNEARLANMISNFNLALDLSKNIMIKVDTWNNIYKLLEPQKAAFDADIKIITGTSTDGGDSTDFTTFTQPVKNQLLVYETSINEYWTLINRRIKTDIATWITNVDAGLNDLQELIKLYQLNVTSFLAEQDASIVYDGNLAATWLVNDSQTDAHKYVKRWNKKNLIVENDLFNFSSKKNLANSSEQIEKKKNLAKIKNLNKRNLNHINKHELNYKMKNNTINKFSNHSNLMSLKKAFQSVNNNCYNIRDNANSLRESVLTEYDMSNNYLLDSGGNGIQSYFDINNKRLFNKKIEKKILNPRYTNLRNTKVKKNIQQNNNVNCNLLKETIIKPNPHKLDHPEETHRHYFPINDKKYGLYIHNHKDNPHSSKKVPYHSFHFFTHRFAKNPVLE